MSHWTRLRMENGPEIHLAARNERLCRLSLAATDGRFLRGLTSEFPGEPWITEPSGILQEAAAQIRAYFEGQLRNFDLPVHLHGSVFQQRVWAELRRIPYGETRSYLDLASALGDPKATRAVGTANGRNPVAIVVPCHRVIAADGTLGGFACGPDLKRMLLNLEGGEWASQGELFGSTSL